MQLLHRSIEIFRLQGLRGYLSAIQRYFLWHPLLDELRWRTHCLFGPKRPIPRNILGHTMLLEPRLGGIHKQLFLYRYREVECTRIFSEMIPRGAIVADIGANIGYYTLIAAGVAKKVYAFEPSPQSVKLLFENTALNHYGDHVEIHEMAISDSTGTASFSISAVPNHHRLLSTAEGKPKKWIEVPTTTFDEFLKDGEVDVIRMDLEGAEWLVIRGMKNLMARSKRPLRLFMEVHPPLMKRYGGDARTMFDLLFEHGFRIRHIVLFGYKHEYSKSFQNYLRAEYSPRQYVPELSLPPDNQVHDENVRQILENTAVYCLFMQR